MDYDLMWTVVAGVFVAFAIIAAAALFIFLFVIGVAHLRDLSTPREDEWREEDRRRKVSEAKKAIGAGLLAFIAAALIYKYG